MPPTQTIRLLALTTDPAVERSLQALARHLPIELMAWPQPDRLAAAFVLHRPDVLLVDADLPCGAAAAAVCEVRGALCKDWVPIVLAGRDPAATQALAARLGDAVDVVLTGPIDETALAPYQNILRRMIALRRINRSAIDRVSEGVVVIDEQGTVRSFNATAERLFGWTADELVGRDVALLMPSPHRERHPGYLAHYHRTGQARVIGIGRQENAVRKDGSEFPMHLTVADISDGGERRYVGVIQDLSVLRQRDELQNRVLRDALTGLPNRVGAQPMIDRVAQRLAAGGEAYALLFCDVDQFKLVNDLHGHAVGDEVLKAVARRLRNAVGERDLVARLSGDEFLIVLDCVGAQAEADAVAARVDRAVSQRVRVGALQVPVRVSVGAAIPTHPDEPSASVLHRADQAMYAVKRARGPARSDVGDAPVASPPGPLASS